MCVSPFIPEQQKYIDERYYHDSVRVIAEHLKCQPHEVRTYVQGSRPFAKKWQREPEKPKIKRPAPVYDNSKSPYGIADRLMEELSWGNGMSRVIIRLFLACLIISGCKVSNISNNVDIYVSSIDSTGPGYLVTVRNGLTLWQHRYDKLPDSIKLGKKLTMPVWRRVK